jgi:hypothetical protein
MPNWKRAAIFGSFTAAALLIIKGHRLPGIVAAGVGAAVLASEYPDEMQSLWDRAPEYIERGTQILSTVSRIKERLEEQGPRAVSNLWRRASEY